MMSHDTWFSSPMQGESCMYHEIGCTGPITGGMESHLKENMQRHLNLAILKVIELEKGVKKLQL